MTDHTENRNDDESGSLICSSPSSDHTRVQIQGKKKEYFFENSSAVTILISCLLVLLGVIIFNSGGEAPGTSTSTSTSTQIAAATSALFSKSNVAVMGEIKPAAAAAAASLQELEEYKEPVHDARVTFDGLERNERNESISATLNVRFPMSADGNSVDLVLTAGPDREACFVNGGTCVYRAYLHGASVKLGGYLYRHMDDDDDDPHNQNVTYQASFPIYAPGNYRLLVMLESMRNASDTFDDEQISDAVCGKLGSYTCLGERVSRSRATVHVDFDAPSYQTDAAVYQATLPRCEYKAANSYHDNFEWTSRALLEAQGFDPKTTGIYPREIMPNQEFVWHSRTCQQPWVSPQSVLDLALGFKESAAIPDSEPGLVIGVLGTSRMRDVYSNMFRYLGANHDNTGPVVMQFSFINVIDNNVESMTQKLKQAHVKDMDQVCVKRNKNRPDAPKVAVLISHAIWEASYHNSYKDLSEHPSKFRFEENARNTLEFVRDWCHGQDYRVVLMTNPAVQLTDSRVPDPYTAVEGPRLHLKDHAKGLSSRGVKIDVANRAWKKIAAEYDVPIVDGEAISFPRWDMSADNVHYRNWCDKDIKCSNEVTMAMIHLLLAALLRAFDH